MRANLESTGGLIYTSAVLLALVESGQSREDAYAARAGGSDGDLARPASPSARRLREHAAERGLKLDEAALDEVCRPERYVERLGRGLRAAGRAVLTPFDAIALRMTVTTWSMKTRSS